MRVKRGQERSVKPRYSRSTQKLKASKLTEGVVADHRDDVIGTVPGLDV